MRPSKWFPLAPVMAALMLVFGSQGFCGELANLESSPNMPFLWGLHDQGEVYWGRWFTEITPLPCGSSKPESCDEMRVALAPGNGNDEAREYGIFFTERAQRWIILGYTGHLGQYEEGEPLVVSMLRFNERRTPHYAVCSAKFGYNSGRIECVPREKGAEERLDIELPAVEFDLAASVGMDRLLALSDSWTTFAVYQKPSLKKVGEDAEGDVPPATTETLAEDTSPAPRHLSITDIIDIDNSEPPKVDEVYSTRLFFAVGTGSKVTVYATPEGENWRYYRSYFGPKDPLGAPPHQLPLIRADDVEHPSLCTARVDVGGVTIESCTPLVEPKAEAEAKPGAGGEGATTTEAKQ